MAIIRNRRGGGGGGRSDLEWREGDVLGNNVNGVAGGPEESRVLKSDTSGGLPKRADHRVGVVVPEMEGQQWASDMALVPAVDLDVT